MDVYKVSRGCPVTLVLYIVILILFIGITISISNISALRL